MKCEIIRDLIPLYDENLCSEESSALVEEHIKTCAACKSLLEKLPEAEIPKADHKEIKPFVKIKRKLRARIVALVSLGVVLLAVLIPVGYLTVNQIFHINGGTDFEDLIYKSKMKKVAEMLAEGRMEDYLKNFEAVGFEDSDGAPLSGQEIYLEKLQAAYEKVKKYNPRVGEIHSDYFKYPDKHITRRAYFILEFTRSDGTVFEVRIDESLGGSSKKYGIPWKTPVEISKLYGGDPENTWYENYYDMEDHSPADLRDICGYINLLYLADGGDYDIKLIEKLSSKSVAEPVPEEFIDSVAHLIAIRFDVADYKAVYNGIAALKRSNYIVETAISSEVYDAERSMFYYPVMLIGHDGDRCVVASIRLYYNEFGLLSPRKEDIKGIEGGSDLELTLAGVFGTTP